MGIWLGKEARVLCQGITGQAGAFHTKLCAEYGTRMVAGVTPGKIGQKVHGVPVFDTCEQAVRKTGADSSLIFVPARFAADAIFEITNDNEIAALAAALDEAVERESEFATALDELDDLDQLQVILATTTANEARAVLDGALEDLAEAGLTAPTASPSCIWRPNAETGSANVMSMFSAPLTENSRPPIPA